MLFLVNESFPQASRPGMAWPPPPERARITHLKTISSLSEISGEKGFFAKALEMLFGGSDSKLWFVQPVGIAVSADGVIYVADPGAGCVHILNLEEKEYSFISEAENGRLKSPVGIAISDDGNLFVSDSELGQVFSYDDDNDLRFAIKDRLQRPTGITISGRRLYVTDTRQNKIVVYDPEGNYLSEFGARGNGPGEFNFPVQLSSDTSLYVVDAMNFRIQRFDLAGNYISAFGKAGTAAGSFANPKSAALDSEGHIYVTDALMDNFQIFSDKGELLLVVGSKGTGDGEFMSPSGIAIDRNDVIYLVDSFNKCLQLFRYLK